MGQAAAWDEETFGWGRPPWARRPRGAPQGAGSKWAGMMAAGRKHGHGQHGHGGPFGPWGGPGGGPWQGFGPFGRGPRAGRGDVRAAILTLLGQAPMHGYQVIQELSERSGGMWRPSPGSVYPTLQLLEDEGLVRSEEVEGKRVFHLTDAGKAEAAKRGPDTPAPWEMGAEAEPFAELRTLGFGLVTAVMQVVQSGNEGQIQKAKEILSEARRSLYRLLAEDEPTDA
jgi:DNA-binding PadR family transcriptional regulator